MSYQELLSILAISISVGTLCISILSFRRNKVFENENHLYKIKIDKCHDILIKTTNILNSIETKRILVDDAMENRTPENLAKIEFLADEVDKEIQDYSFFVSANCLVLPKSTVKLIEKLIDEFFKSDFEEGETIEQSQLMEGYYLLADKIHASMRMDLNIDALNVSLYTRIKK